jgi:sec-independent protein translocase protein TatB
MFNVDVPEFLLVAFLALIFIGPKELPTAMRVVGRWVGKARAVASQFRSGFDDMVRQSELEELERKWREENDRIMRENPIPTTPVLDVAADLPEPADAKPKRARAKAKPKAQM